MFFEYSRIHRDGYCFRLHDVDFAELRNPRRPKKDVRWVIPGGPHMTSFGSVAKTSTPIVQHRNP